MLTKRWQKADDEEKAALNQLSSELRKNLLQLCRMETILKKQRQNRRQRKAFFNSPFLPAHGNTSRDIPLGDCPFQLPTLKPQLSARSTCTARPPSFTYQFHRWWKNSMLIRQEQSVHNYCLKMRKSDTLARPSSVAGNRSLGKQ